MITLRILNPVLDDFAPIRELRREIPLPLLETTHLRELEQDRDEMGLVAAFYRSGELIGTLRLLPLGFGLAPCERGLEGEDLPEQILENSCEIGRLVLAREHRDDSKTLLSCLQLMFQYVTTHTRYRNGIGVCGDRLARLYRKFGATPIVRNSNCAGMNLVHCSLATIRAAFAERAEYTVV